MQSAHAQEDRNCTPVKRKSLYYFFERVFPSKKAETGEEESRNYRLGLSARPRLPPKAENGREIGVIAGGRRGEGCEKIKREEERDFAEDFEEEEEN